MEHETICKEGIVRSVEGDAIKTYQVEITISSACSECHAKSICLPSDHKQELVPARSMYGKSFAPGDKVRLVLKGSAGTKAVAIAYCFPFVIMMVVLYGLNAIIHNELISAIVSVVCVVTYYLILRHFRGRFDKHFEFFIR